MNYAPGKYKLYLELLSNIKVPIETIEIPNDVNCTEEQWVTLSDNERYGILLDYFDEYRDYLRFSLLKVEE